MRLSTEAIDDDVALATIAAALDAGVTVFDTAHAYGKGPGDAGQNERLLARGIRGSGGLRSARVVTKGGMKRTAVGWVPDGRAGAILADCEGSLAALDGVAIDLFLLHAPDPRTPWRTSMRALARLLDEGMVRRVGVSNVNLRQLEEALDVIPVAAVQVSLSVYDDRALRGGIVDRCADSGIGLIAHSPLGGPRRVGAMVRDKVLTEVARTYPATPAQVALAWLLSLSPVLVAIPGARHPEAARSAAGAAAVTLDAGARDAVGERFGARRSIRQHRPDPADGAEVVLVMGIPGAGKSRVAEEFVGRGYLRLNRDERGRSLRDLAGTLDEELRRGARHVVLDNTYLSRAARSHVIEVAGRQRISTRCVWVDTPLAQAQVNLVERLLERFGALPTPEEIKAAARREPGLLMPTAQMRALRELESPSTDEGFAAVERIPFARTPPSPRARVGVFVAAEILTKPGWKSSLGMGDRDAPHLVFDWRPDGAPGDLAEMAARVSVEVSGAVETAVCLHGGGPPSCWCRPPLPGLLLAFARVHGIAPSRSVVIGSGISSRTLAATLGARHVAG